MRGFEQAISKPRYHLTQFHRPAMLKLVTVTARPCGGSNNPERQVRSIPEGALRTFIFTREEEQA